MTWSLALPLSKGRGQSSCWHLKLSERGGRPKAEDTTAWHRAEKISTFHQKKLLNGLWAAFESSEKGASGANWLHAFTIYITFAALSVQRPFRGQEFFFPRSWMPPFRSALWILLCKKEYICFVVFFRLDFLPADWLQVKYTVFIEHFMTLDGFLITTLFIK